MYKKPQDVAACTAALKFFAWAYEKGDKMADDLDYIPMPDQRRRRIKKTWAAEIKDGSGKPLFKQLRARPPLGRGRAPCQNLCG